MAAIRRAFRFSKYQLDILLNRYSDIWLADLGSLTLLLLQAPIIACFIVLVWRDVEQATDTTYFVMTLSAIWFGTINSAREIVKERSLVAREVAVGLELGSYVISKFAFLLLLGFVQCLLLVVVVNWNVPMVGNLFGHFVVMFAASAAGTAMGLAVSALCQVSDRAVAMVPILLLPQILFSQVVLTKQFASSVTTFLQNMTISEWAYGAQLALTEAEVEYWVVVKAVIVLTAMSAALLLASVVFMASVFPQASGVSVTK